MAKDKDGNDIAEDTQTNGDDLSPTERKKFGKFLDEFLAEDDATPAPTPARTSPGPGPAAAPASSGGVDIEAAINRALDARSSKTKDDEWRTGIEGALAELTTPKKKKWHQPWTLFSGVL